MLQFCLSVFLSRFPPALHFDVLAGVCVCVCGTFANVKLLSFVLPQLVLVDIIIMVVVDQMPHHTEKFMLYLDYMHTRRL